MTPEQGFEPGGLRTATYVARVLSEPRNERRSSAFILHDQHSPVLTSEPRSWLGLFFGPPLFDRLRELWKLSSVRWRTSRETTCCSSVCRRWTSARSQPLLLPA
jgi:hypothetical protein